MTEAIATEPVVPVQTARDIRWDITGAMTGYLDREGVRFGVVLQRLFDEWQVIGFVTRVPVEEPAADSYQRGLARVLAQHAHQPVGSFHELANAQWAACDFLLEAPVPTELCGCKAVVPP